MRTLPHRPATSPPPATTPAHPHDRTRQPTDPATAPPRPRWPGHDLLAVPETAQVLSAAWSGDPAVVVPSPPGAGKTRLVALLAAALAHRADLRVGLAAQTREQALELARRIGTLSDRARLIWPAKNGQPDSGNTPAVHGGKAVFPHDHGGILIATTARWLYGSPTALGCDVMLVDEAWQATYGDLGALGAYAAQIVCVGDPGQIDPVVTGSTARWQHNPTGPHLPAPDALRAAHGDAIGVITLRHTWRLGPDTTALIQPAFYPALPFTSRRPPEHLTTATGTVLPELSHLVVTATGGPGDPTPLAACAARARDLLTTTTITDATGTRPTTPADVTVVCAHVAQAAAVRAALADLPDVLVGTANQLQGLERPAVVVLHPLAGYRDLTAGFTLDLGRACVMLSRHRAHATVILDAATPDVLRAADPDDHAARVHRALTADLLDRPTT